MTDAPPNAAPPAIFMVDDNHIACQAMERFIASHPLFRWAGSSTDAAAAVAEVGAARPDVVLLDVDIPGSDAYAVLAGLLALSPPPAVIMFSGHSAPHMIERALEAGAAGYIVKDEPTTVISALLLRAARGQSVLSPIASAAYMNTRRPRP